MEIKRIDSQSSGKGPLGVVQWHGTYRSAVSGADFPGEIRIMALEVDRQHDRQRVRNDGRNVVSIHVRCYVLPLVPARQAHREPHQAQRTDQKAQGVSRQQVRHTERNRNTYREQEKDGNHHLRQVEADLRNSRIDITASEYPPTMCHGLRS